MSMLNCKQVNYVFTDNLGVVCSRRHINKFFRQCFDLLLIKCELQLVEMSSDYRVPPVWDIWIARWERNG